MTRPREEFDLQRISIRLSSGPSWRLSVAAFAAVSVAVDACGSRSDLGPLAETTVGGDGGVIVDASAVDASVGALPPVDSGSVRDSAASADSAPPADVCDPTCDLVVCGGSDGCGGTCASGPCPNAEVCLAGACHAVVLYGGEDTIGAPSGDMTTWTWDGRAWTEHLAPGPPARSGGAMAAFAGPAPMSTERSVVLFGGTSLAFPVGPLGDTWTWDGEVWSQELGPGPDARRTAVMAGLGSTVVLTGGTFVGSTGQSDTWLWDGAVWTQTGALGPTFRQLPAMTALGGEGFFVGGLDHVDQWVWNGTSWSTATVPGPSTRVAHAMAERSGKVVLFGGVNAGAFLADTWEWDGQAWTQRMVTGPSPRGFHAMATLGDTVVLFGGEDENGALGDTWTWDGQAWTDVTGAGSDPPARFRHAMATR